MLYHRLHTLKALATEMANAEKKFQRLSPLAADLGLAQQVPMVDMAENPPTQFYEHLLELCEKLFDGEIDQNMFEESLRYMWGVKAFPIFTVDKVISSMIKHVCSQHLFSLCLSFGWAD
jgi:paired amphipathic helix protein Sin3a